MNLITTATVEEVKEKILIHINGVSDGVLDKNYFTEIIDLSDFIEMNKEA